MHITRPDTFHSAFTRLLSFVFAASIGFMAMAQNTTAGISGTVSDSTGETIPGAGVTLLLPSTGTSRSNVTNMDGKYNVVNLDPGGPYTVTAAFVGYSTWKLDNVYLKLGETLKLNIKLSSVKTELKTVEVVAKAGGNQLRTGTGTDVGREQIQTLPTLSRSFSDMTRLTPQSSNNSFAGTNFRYNNISLDGAVNNDAIGFSPSMGGISGTSNAPGSSTRSNSFSLDAIQEVQVAIAPYDVSLGNFTGGSINAVSRRGTNDVTGSVYGYGRNSSITGPYTGVGSVGDGKINSDYYDYQTGLRVGLPLIKDKLFFFTNEEITRNQTPVQYPAGSPGYFMTNTIANQITTHLENMPVSTYNPYGGFDPGTAGAYDVYAKSTKYFNRLDWQINNRNTLSVRNNTVISEASNLEHSSTEFQFASYDFIQKNRNISTVAELKSTLTDRTSNSLIIGYTDISDVRDPIGQIFPQIQINNVNGGGTVFLGTDREAGIFNMKQRTFEFTDNLKYFTGNHKFTFGTHNELYNIQYGFINSWNGRYDYNSLDDFLADKPARMRGIYNPVDNSRANNFANTPALYNVDMYSVYAQDEWDATKKLTLTYGVRGDLTIIPNGPPTTAHNSFPDNVPNYGTTYTTDNMVSAIGNTDFGKPTISPRVGFNFDVNGDKSLILRGGSGIFTGRIPFAWIGYTYVNSGTAFNAFDYSPNGAIVPIPTDPTQYSSFASSVGAGGRKELDILDKNFVMPKIWRSNLAADIKMPMGYMLTLEGIYTKTLEDVAIQQINLKDSVYYASYDTQQQQPLYLSGGPTANRVSNDFSSVYLITNTDKGERYQLTAQVKKQYKWGMDLMAAYTYAQSKDVLNGIRNSPESGWQVNQSLSPNNAPLAWSNFDIRNRIVSSLGYNKQWSEHTTTHVSFLLTAESGSPFTWVIGSNNLTRNGQQVDLAFIPANEGQLHLVDKTDGQGNVTETAHQQWQELDAFINGEPYLNSRRGQFTERNGDRTPWNNRLDMRVMQDFNLTHGKHTNTLQVSLDIINLANLIDSKSGWFYFTPNTRNSSVNTGLNVTRANNSSAEPTYTFTTPSATYSIDQFNSRWQMQLGLRYSF